MYGKEIITERQHEQETNYNSMRKEKNEQAAGHVVEALHGSNLWRGK